MTRILQLFRGRQDLALIALLLVTVLVMIVPLPTMLIDALIVLNIALTVAILVVAVYLKTPEDFSAFPAIILIGTTFRLAISISTTRMILAQADAGKIVETFGNFVTAGSVIIGLVIFLIITTVQFIVVTKGSERVAEVAARFTLDALPGRQMSIDAELRSGDIDQAEAKSRRAKLEKQNQFFGAMDGAMKFVKGDAIAGLIIIVINLIGGISIGVIERGMATGDAISVYSQLTVGDGLVAQLPALIFAVAAGTIITRVITDKSSDLGTDIVTQLVGNEKSLMVTGGVIAGIGLIPGFPTLMFFFVGGLAAFGGYALYRKNAAAASDGGGGRSAGSGSENLTNSETLAVKPNDIFKVVAGKNVIDQIDAKRFIDAREVSLDDAYRKTGVWLTEYGIEHDPILQPNQLSFVLDGISIFSASIAENMSVVVCDEDLLSINSIPFTPLDSVWPMRSAYWVNPDHCEALVAADVEIIDQDTLLTRAASHYLRVNASRIIGFDAVQSILRSYAEGHQQVATQVAQTLSVVQLLNVFRLLLNDGVPLLPRRILFESLLEASVQGSEPDMLAEAARTALSRQICARHADDNRVIAGYLIDPSCEERIKSELQILNNGAVSMPPALTERVLASARNVIGMEDMEACPPAIIVAKELRRPFSQFLKQNHIEVDVLSFGEIAREFVVNPIGLIGDENTTPVQQAA